MTNASFVYQYLFDEDHSVSAVKKANINELAASNQTLWQHLDLNRMEFETGLSTTLASIALCLKRLWRWKRVLAHSP